MEVSSSSRTAIDSEVARGGCGNLNSYLPLERAIFNHDWETMKKFLNSNPGSIREIINGEGDTPLILVAKQGRRSNGILKWLISLMPLEALTIGDNNGNTALHVASMLGNVGGSAKLVGKNRALPNVHNRNGLLPLHFAASHGHRDMMLYLLDVTRDAEDPKPFEGNSGAMLMRAAMNSRFYDVALHLLDHNRSLAWQQDFSPLEVMAQEPSAFPSGSKLNYRQRILYSCINEKKELFQSHDVEFNLSADNLVLEQLRVVFWEILYRLREVLWKVPEIIVPRMETIRKTKLLHREALELLRRLCREIEHLSNSVECLRNPFLLAAQFGIHEFVEEILKYFPSVITSIDKDNRTVLHLAVKYRHENVYNVLNDQHGVNQSVDRYNNNILHLAGCMAQQAQLDLVSSAVLQMQRELQWFQEVDRLVLPKQRKEQNIKGQTPLELFYEEHKDMVAYERQWMIGMANSCTVATTIIGTLAFAAAITVPGGNKGDGSPIFSGETAFIIFAVSNALALFSSICTLLIFLSILTSRYAVIDYLYSLPNRLIMGLIFLFLSITSMIIAFSSTLYLVFAQKSSVILIPIAVLALLPVTLFVLLQSPLLLNMMQTTYGHSMFTSNREQS